jgi:hypothetical protein
MTAGSSFLHCLLRHIMGRCQVGLFIVVSVLELIQNCHRQDWLDMMGSSVHVKGGWPQHRSHEIAYCSHFVWC